MNLPIKPAVLLLSIALIAVLAVACGSGDEVAAEPTETAVIISAPESSGLASSALTTNDTPVPGSTDGTFVVGEGSEATFTVNEKLSSLPLPNDAVMRTSDITGEIDLSASSAALVINLHSLRSDSTRRDSYISDRLFPRQPGATITVAEFPDIPEEFAEGQSFTSMVLAIVNVNGTDAEIEFELESRLDPDRLLVLVKGDFTWADFGMSAPTSRSFVVTDDVHVEVLVSAAPK
jgi:hypothetical protein